MKVRSYMQTIIRYELVINEALRFTLMLDTPDEQINEFIRFFLENILDVIEFIMQSKNTRDFSHEMNQVSICQINKLKINDKYSALNIYICYNIDEEKHMEVVKGRTGDESFMEK